MPGVPTETYRREFAVNVAAKQDLFVLLRHPVCDICPGSHFIPRAQRASTPMLSDSFLAFQLSLLGHMLRLLFASHLAISGASRYGDVR